MSTAREYKNRNSQNENHQNTFDKAIKISLMKIFAFFTAAVFAQEAADPFS